MKLLITSLVIIFSVNISAAKLTCTASLFSESENEKTYLKAYEWMEKNNIQDEELLPEELKIKPVKTDIRTIELDEKGDADLLGIIIDSYEAHGIYYNYAAQVKSGYFVYIGAENEVQKSGSGTSLKKQKEASFSSSSLLDGSRLILECKVL